MVNQYTVIAWTKEEIKLLKKHYPILGQKVQQFLPNRTRDQIDHKIRELDIHYGLFEKGEEAFLDIETSNLNADFAYMLSYAIKVKDCDIVHSGIITKAEIFSGEFDKRLVADCIEVLRKFKRIYTYYGTKFDLSFLRTRALIHNLEFIPFGLIQHQDLYYLVRNKLKLSRNRLENVCEALGVNGKTRLDGHIWVKATIGDKKSLGYILEHNIQDVLILEKVYNKIKTYAGVQRRSI